MTITINASGKTPEQIIAMISRANQNALQQYTARVHDVVLGEATVERKS